MIEIAEKTFENMTLFIDNNNYIKCTFNNCTLIYHGTAGVGFNGCSLNNVKWSLDGAAGLTMKFLAQLYHGMGIGGQELVEKTFQNIKDNKI